MFTLSTSRPAVHGRKMGEGSTGSKSTMSMASQTMSGTQNFTGSMMSESSSFSNSTVIVDESDTGSIIVASSVDFTNAQVSGFVLCCEFF